MAAPDFVIVDDSNPTIKYGAGWTLDNNADTPLGTTGPPLYNTLHSATSQTKFTFTYNGAFGSLFVIGSVVSDSPPSWNCTVDNKPLPTFQPQEQTNHFQLCGSTAGPGITGDHTLQVNVDASEGSPFAFDYVLYTPAPKIRPGDLTFDSSNAQIQYGPLWTQTPLGQVTLSAGEKLEFDFNGHSLTWFGFFNENIPSGQATATYSMDGLDPITFFINNAQSGQSEMTDQLFFQTPPFPVGRHHLEVVFRGSEDGIPLSLNRIVVQNNTVGIQPTAFPSDALGPGTVPTAGLSRSLSPAVSASTGTPPTIPVPTGQFQASGSRPGATSSTTSRPSVTPTPSGASGVRKSSPQPIVIVGIIIVVAVVFICIALLIRRRRLRRISDSSRAMYGRPDPFHHLPMVELNPTSGKHQEHVRLPSIDVDREGTIPSPSTTIARRWLETTASVFRINPAWSTKQAETISTPSPSSRRPPRVMMHQDSGVQLPQPDGESEIIEVPPAYGSISGR
ncbi:hypothetical protein GALMADRAFT_143102 [Galerina marginata CBS 339.88]|uniref:Uncharacterized protein n=1 Tax=Galerina marginata (strain CBS 339.88) TaxID=685588 RepID=A0A067SZP0_GALM3|nr:hypothetical protein GALMADRAFT_143102 [Galerina marginata CBS 339.88]